MQGSFRRGVVRRIMAAGVLLTYAVGCTHMPSGEKAFDTFDECIASNLALAAVGGAAAGALGAAITKQTTGSKSKATAVGAAAGIATAVSIGMVAWRKCAAVYSTSKVVAAAPPPPPEAPTVTGPRRRPGLTLDRLHVRVEGNEDAAPGPEFSFSYVADDAAAKDIKAIFRHKVEIVRFKAADNDKLVLADANDQPLLDRAGRPIPLEMAQTMPHDRLAWTTIADEGKQDYVEDVVIQQGHSKLYAHKLQVPPRAQLPLPLPVPMRYTLTVQVGEKRSSRTVDFAILPTKDRPKRYAAGAATTAAPAAATVAPAAATESAPGASADPNFAATHSLKRTTSVYDAATTPRKAIGQLKAKTPVRVDGEAEVKAGKNTVQWMKVVPQTGTGGWLRAGELVEIK